MKPTVRISPSAPRVATDLRMIQAETHNQRSNRSNDAYPAPRDLLVDGTVYRRLDPEYYAWLRCRMVRAKKAFEAGKLPPAAWEVLRSRFNAVHDLAIDAFGEQKLVAASEGLDERNYLPPRHEHAVALWEAWSERAAIFEFDAGQIRAEAENAATRLYGHLVRPEDLASFQALGIEIPGITPNNGNVRNEHK